MKVFTFISISFLPETVIGCLFGMNVTVPWQYSTTLVPFYGILGVAFSMTLCFFIYFRYLKYI
jgi:Mg2+ and Co2+ transporter CorA